MGVTKKIKKIKKKAKPEKVQIKSMTGFGKAGIDSPYGKISVEIKTLNHKTLSISCNPFSGVFLLEQKLQKAFGKKIFRGKAFVRVLREDDAGQKKIKQIIEVNEKVLGQYFRKIRKAQKNLNINGEVGIQDLIAFPGVIESVQQKKVERPWPYVEQALNGAIENLVMYRKKEGLRLAKDFNIRLRAIEKNVLDIAKYAKESVVKYREKLIQSLRDVSKSGEFDKNKLENEVATFARNCDIAEELTRLSGHIIEYKDTICDVRAEVGKKLDFIAQEMQREANTIGSKASDFRISKAVIDVKSDIEKLREQINNIE